MHENILHEVARAECVQNTPAAAGSGHSLSAGRCLSLCSASAPESSKPPSEQPTFGICGPADL